MPPDVLRDYFLPPSCGVSFTPVSDDGVVTDPSCVKNISYVSGHPTVLLYTHRRDCVAQRCELTPVDKEDKWVILSPHAK